MFNTVIKMMNLKKKKMNLYLAKYQICRLSEDIY